MQVTFTPQAKTDLLEIALYIAQDNQERALQFTDALESHCYKLGDMPKIGTLREELGNGIRMMPHGRYLIFYRTIETHVQIVRILHSAMDISADDFAGNDTRQ